LQLCKLTLLFTLLAEFIELSRFLILDYVSLGSLQGNMITYRSFFGLPYFLLVDEKYGVP
jgi:hypothetical protein